jgi:hypothetical protein
MRPLPQKFTKNGFTFEVLNRNDRYAILKKTRLPQGKWYGFEVIEIQRHNGFDYEGASVPPSEYLPAITEWGLKGFTFTADDRAGADKKFSQLTNFVPTKTGHSRSLRLTLNLQKK